MEVADKKTAVAKSVGEESYITSDAERSPSSPDKDTMERGMKSKRKSTATTAVELDDQSNETDSSDANKILKNNASTPVHRDGSTPRSSSSPRPRSGESRSSRISTRASASTPTSSSRRSTRTSGRNFLVEGLKEASPSSGSRSSGSKPLRDSTGRFISKTMQSEGGHDRVTTEEPPKQALDTSESSKTGEKEISGEREKGLAQKKTISIMTSDSRPQLQPEDLAAANAKPLPKKTADAEIQKPAAVPQSHSQLSNSDSTAEKNIAASSAAPSLQNAISDSALIVQMKPIAPPSESLISRNAEVQSSMVMTEPTPKLIVPPASKDVADSTDVHTSEAAEPKPPPASMLAMNSSPAMSQTVAQAADEAAIDAARAPLSNLYGQYICKSTDASLEDARKRLRKAITQTRELRQLFTDRVYDKYRVCMKPPPAIEEIFARIMKDPAGEQRRLKDEIAAIRAEKELEKLETAKLNTEMQQSAAGERASLLSNVDNAEQVMYMTAGLNLVILPEDQPDPKFVMGYADRGPINSDGQRVRNISQAAATAGEVILDRTRKAAAMRVERQRRRQLQLLRKEAVADGESESNYSRLQILKAASSSTASGKEAPKTSKTIPTLKQASVPATRKVTTSASKAVRSRLQSSLSANALLSLNATADELKIGTKPNAATSALIARGVGPAANKTMQQRLRHPHLDSLGGRRRTNANPMKQSGSLVPPEPFVQANLANTLPPLPSTKDRLERKPLPVHTLEYASSERARKSIQHVTQCFASDGPNTEDLRPVLKINLLNDLRRNYSGTPNASESPQSRPFNPFLTFSVLRALGIVAKPQDTMRPKPYRLPKTDPENKAMWSDDLTALSEDIASNTLSGTPLFGSRKRPCSSDAEELEPKPKVPRTNASTRMLLSPAEKSIPFHNTYGDSEKTIAPIPSVEKDGSQASAFPESKSSRNETNNFADEKIAAVSEPKKRKRSDSPPGRPSMAVVVAGTTSIQSNHNVSNSATSQTSRPGFRGPSQIGATANSIYPAIQHHQIQNPSNGNLVDFLGGYPPHGYEISPLMTGATQAQQLAGSVIAERASAAAAAKLLRDQQAAAFLGGFPPPGYPQVASFSAFFGGQTPLAQPQQTTLPGLAPNNFPKQQSPTTAPETSGSLTERDSNDVLKGRKQHQPPAITVNNTQDQQNLKYEHPLAPCTLSSEQAKQIQTGNFHKIATELDGAGSVEALKYLVLSGFGVPIPKSLVVTPLKERLNTPGFKNIGGSAGLPFTRDVVAAAILVWLWSTHEQTFQQAFKKNGRIDVDPDCKWLVHAAVDFAISELSLEIAESMATGEGAFAEAAANRVTSPADQDVTSALEKSDLCTASIVSRALKVEICVDGDLIEVIPKFQKYVGFLDESRIGALRAKSQERALLASLIARKSMMTENFAHAYVSAMVRAGEALGHDKLFELAQDEETMSSTMIPYDILTDDSGFWEEPCKPKNGFTEGLTGDDLVRRSHARAMVQKSLRKLQVRNHIRGGSSSYGPFVDQSNAETEDRKPVPGPSPRPGPKRRNSSLVEPTITSGTGSAEAKSWRVYDPCHSCSPLDWDPDVLDNGPYGVHAVSSERIRSMSLSLGRGATDAKTKRSMSLSLSQLAPRAQSESESKILQSTRGIEWEDVASTFQSVELPKKTSRNANSDNHHHSTPVFVDGTIFAPYCRKIEGELSTEESESDTEEDLTEETTLARHQVVLDDMKQKLNAYLEARKKQQEARKNRYR